MIFDTYESLQQSAMAAFDRQAQLLMQYLRRLYFLKAFAVEIKEMSQPYIMHLFVPIRDDCVQLAAD